MAALRLYGYAVSSCVYRVRIALNVKEVEYDYVTVGKDVALEEYRTEVNSQGLVPLLQNGSDRIAQSLSILEYAEEALSGVKLLPNDARGRARVRGIAGYIVSEIQPLQNTRIGPYLQSLVSIGRFALGGAFVARSANDTFREALGQLQKVDPVEWNTHWVLEGLRHLEAMLSGPETGQFCHGDDVTIADCCLVPQVYNALVRFKLSIDDYPNVKRIYEHCTQLPAFERARPENQADYVPPEA